MKSEFTEAKAQIIAVLQEYAPIPDGKTDPLAPYVEAWNLTEAGYRVAEVGWTSGTGGAAYMQSDLPHGLAICAAVERAVIARAFLDPESAQEAEDDLRWLIGEDIKDAQSQA